MTVENIFKKLKDNASGHDPASNYFFKILIFIFILSQNEYIRYYIWLTTMNKEATNNKLINNLRFYYNLNFYLILKT